MLIAFTTSLLLITAAEFGDKTFFVALILAMRHLAFRSLIFWGVLAALGVMTIMSVLAGNVLSLVPRIYVHYAEIALFVFFGVKLLYDASRMSAKIEGEEEQDAAAFVHKAELKLPQKKTRLAIFREAFSLTFIAELGDRTQITTIALAATYHPMGVIAGSVLGHAICTGIAVIGGRLLAKRISERTVTVIGGLLYLLFAILATFEGS
ncbi:MAG: TMEM165/GDT1 family protein [Stigonema ocellatum SAG 48.90 = DSM 106950]|nr:TMEM165/GDT1 family protein [Stigonema ocellatum SAG 48.90 = DSM 106950]